MKSTIPYILYSLYVSLFIVACAPPKLTDVMPKEGVKCKAEITMPDEREPISVVTDVRIFDCH